MVSFPIPSQRVHRILHCPTISINLISCRLRYRRLFWYASPFVSKLRHAMAALARALIFGPSLFLRFSSISLPTMVTKTQLQAIGGNNALWCEWLQEWKEECAESGTQREYGYTKVYNLNASSIEACF